MAFSVQMPALGESVTEGTVTRWLKQEGDTVEVDEPLLEVSTDKVDTEIPSPAAGVLSKIVANEDDVVEVGGQRRDQDRQRRGELAVALFHLGDHRTGHAGQRRVVGPVHR
ncbi:biotin/lipoyl-containing protein, partial [Nocardia gipuzkoensis]|uniref:biotin/lipoyl-containing protein n=1 Tax=Nocardia gipuzkoensis TaxID=2749991 RepID=UPI003F69FCD2